MKVKIKRVDKSLPLPMYETTGSVGFDFLCRGNYTVPPKDIGRIPSNTIVEVPDGYTLLVALRSSTPVKKSLMMPHGIGVLDNDYCGEEDEILIQVYNFSDEPVEVKRGERIAQGVFVKTGRAEWEEVDKMLKESRGGLGSTDKNKG